MSSICMQNAQYFMSHTLSRTEWQFLQEGRCWPPKRYGRTCLVLSSSIVGLSYTKGHLALSSGSNCRRSDSSGLSYVQGDVSALIGAPEAQQGMTRRRTPQDTTIWALGWHFENLPYVFRSSNLQERARNGSSILLQMCN